MSREYGDIYMRRSSRINQLPAVSYAGVAPRSRQSRCLPPSQSIKTTRLANAKRRREAAKKIDKDSDGVITLQRALTESLAQADETVSPSEDHCHASVASSEMVLSDPVPVDASGEHSQTPAIGTVPHMNNQAGTIAFSAETAPLPLPTRHHAHLHVTPSCVPLPRHDDFSTSTVTMAAAAESAASFSAPSPKSTHTAASRIVAPRIILPASIPWSALFRLGLQSRARAEVAVLQNGYNLESCRIAWLLMEISQLNKTRHELTCKSILEKMPLELRAEAAKILCQ